MKLVMVTQKETGRSIDVMDADAPMTFPKVFGFRCVGREKTSKMKEIKSGDPSLY